MAKKEVVAEFGNLICRFGEKKVLVDHLEEIVIPAFFDNKLSRNYADTSYFFFGVELVDLSDSTGERIAAIAGRIIKDTRIVREQVFDRDKGLQKDEKSLKSSPSSFFLLILNNHRLVYVRETSDAPSMQVFRSMLYGFLRSKHNAYINSLLEDLEPSLADARAASARKKELLKKIPMPSLELIPLTSNQEIAAFIDRFTVLKTIEIVARERNDELDNKEFFAKMHGLQEEVGSVTTTLKHSNAKGLDPDSAVVQITDATEQGNNLIKLSGVDTEGDTLRGNNEEFQLKRPMERLGADVAAAAARLYRNFTTLVTAGAIKIPATPRKTKEALEKALSELD